MVTENVSRKCSQEGIKDFWFRLMMLCRLCLQDVAQPRWQIIENKSSWKMHVCLSIPCPHTPNQCIFFGTLLTTHGCKHFRTWEDFVLKTIVCFTDNAFCWETLWFVKKKNFQGIFNEKIMPVVHKQTQKRWRQGSLIVTSPCRTTAVPLHLKNALCLYSRSAMTMGG